MNFYPSPREIDPGECVHCLGHGMRLVKMSITAFGWMWCRACGGTGRLWRCKLDR